MACDKTLWISCGTSRPVARTRGAAARPRRPERRPQDVPAPPRALAAEACLPRSPAGPGRVRVLSANQARHLDADHVFLLGLGERSFPRLTPPQIAVRRAGTPGAAERRPGPRRRRPVARGNAAVLSGRRAAPGGNWCSAIPPWTSAARRCCRVPSCRRCATASSPKLSRQANWHGEMLIEGFNRDEPLSAAEYRVRAAAAWQAGGLHDPALPADLRANLLDAADSWNVAFRDDGTQPLRRPLPRPGRDRRTDAAVRPRARVQPDGPGGIRRLPVPVLPAARPAAGAAGRPERGNRGDAPRPGVSPGAGAAAPQAERRRRPRARPTPSRRK